MRILLTVIFLILFSSITASSQNLNIEWAKSIINYSSKFNIDVLDNVIVHGYFSGTVDFDPGPGVFNQTGTSANDFIYKLDSSGNFVWAVMFSNPGIDIANITLLPSGSFIATIQGTPTPSDIDPGPGVVNVSGDCIVKFNSNGQYLFHKQGMLLYNNQGIYNSNFVFYSHYSNTTPTDIDPGPGVFLTAPYTVCIATYDTSLNFVSGVNYPHPTGFNHFQMDNNGNFIFGGEYDSQAQDLIPGSAVANLPLVITPTNPLYQNYFIAKTDHNFNPVWSTAFARNSPWNYDEVEMIDDGSIILCAEVSNGDTLYPALGSAGIRIVNNTPTYYNNAFIKYDNIGQYVRHMRLPIDNYQDVEFDGNDKFYITGTIDFTANLDFDPSGANYNIVNNDPGCRNIYLAIYDTSFGFKGAYMMGGTFCDSPYQIHSTNSGDQIYLGASHSNALDVDVSANNYMLPSPNPNDGSFVAKYNTSSLNNVWPGDANQDLIVDNFDILSIGLYNGEPTEKRFNISNLWQPYYALMYGISQYNGNDIQYADCNGNGTISITDTTAIRQNYGLSHILRQSQANRVTVGPDLYFQTTATFVAPGSIVNVDILVGTSNLSMYGIGFNIPINPSLIQPGTVSLSFAPSWLGTPGTNAIKFGKFTGTSVDGTLVRNNQTNATGFGKIATLTFQVANNISIATTFPLAFSNYLSLTNNGTDVPLTPLTNSFIVDPLLEVPALEDQVSMSIYPNVTSDVFSLHMQLNKSADAQFTLINVVGELVSEIETIHPPAGVFTKEFNISNLSNGIYFLKCALNGNVSYNRIVKL